MSTMISWRRRSLIVKNFRISSGYQSSSINHTKICWILTSVLFFFRASTTYSNFSLFSYLKSIFLSPLWKSLIQSISSTSKTSHQKSLMSSFSPILSSLLILSSSWISSSCFLSSSNSSRFSNRLNLSNNSASISLYGTLTSDKLLRASIKC